MTVAGDQRDVKTIPCPRCVAAFQDERERRALMGRLYIVLQECRTWVHCPDVLPRLDAALSELRRLVENPQETLRK